MSAATILADGHEAYLRALDRALRVGLVVSLAVHAALAGLLPSPFHHEHPLPRTLEVNLAEVPPVPTAPSMPEPQVQPPAPVPTEGAAVRKPERLRPSRPSAPLREPAAVASPAPAAEGLLTQPEPERTAASVPTPAVATEARTAPTAPADSKPEGSDTGPLVPPSFRAGYLRNPEPVYPTASRRLGEEGTVQLRVLVSAEGQPVRVDLYRSSGHPRLDEAAAAAVREWRFVAARRGMTPVEATVIVPIVFRLEVE